MRTQRVSMSVCAALAVCAFTVGAYAQGEPPAGDPANPPTTPPEGTPPAQPADPAQPTDPAQPAQPGEPGERPDPPVEPPKPTTETQCTDGIDEDGDGTMDCADPDCQADPACKPPEPPPAPVAPTPVAPTPVAPMPPPAPEEDKPAKLPPPEMTLGIEGLAGVTGRVGSISSGYDSAERAGLQYGLGAFFAPNRQFAFGLSYVYSGFGAEEFNPTVNDSTGKIRRRLHNAMLGLRAYPLRNDTIGLWAGLGVGLTWQTASASGATATGDFVQPSRSYQVGVGPSSGLALGGAIGMDYDISNDVALLTSVAFTNHRLSSDPLDGSDDPVIPGVGSASQLDFRLAFQYRFDLAGTPSPVTASVETASK